MEKELTPTVGGYIYLAAVGCPTLRVPIVTADQAVAALERYRDENGLGSSDFKRSCGNIRSHDGTLVARVSYNGRVWDLNGKLLQDINGGLPMPSGNGGNDETETR
jgi:hypothetical protein